MSDLSAAYLASAEADRPALVVDAIVAAARASELAPNEPVAAFNRALTLENAALPRQATHAWEHYLALDDDESWRAEASRRLARLKEPTTAERWMSEKAVVMAAAKGGDEADLLRLARLFPQQIKELLEKELLPAWADAVGSPGAEERLAVARGVAKAVAANGDALYVDAIAAIEARPAAAKDQAQAIQTYAVALAERGECSRSESGFERAFQILSLVENPLASAARLEYWVCVYRRDPGEAGGPLAELAASLEARPYPALRAKVAAIRGLCDVAGGRYSLAIPHYEQAIQLLRQVGETDLARLQGMLAEAYELLGDRDNAWRYRSEGLRTAVAAGNHRFIHAILAGLARRLVQVERSQAARLVLEEMLANARAWSEPGAEAETLARLVQLDLASGSPESAIADIAAFKRAAEKARQPGDRERIETELIIASAEQELLASRPAEALRTIEMALDRLGTNTDGLARPRAWLDLSRIQLALGDLAAAEEALERALSEQEALRAATVSEEHRISILSLAQQSFEAMIRFQAVQRGDARKAFQYSEQIRARTLQDRVLNQRRAPTAPVLDVQLRRIPEDVVVIAYTVLPEVLLVWKLQTGTLVMTILPVPRSEVSQLVSRVETAMSSSGSVERGKEAASAAFEALFRPMAKSLPVDSVLVFVPDRELFRLPFGALFDRERGRFLIEDHPCAVTPSLSLYLGLRDRDGSRPRALRRILAVGDPAFDPERFRSTDRLPFARKEAEAIVKLYPEGVLLVDREATRERILDELPRSDVVHVAAHVLVDERDPLGSVIVTSAEGSGVFQASDLDARRLANASLVFLSGCDTAPGFPDSDREGVAGLARAVLAAGAPAVVATLWAVEDETAFQLASLFHVRLLRGGSPEDALRFSQQSLLGNSPSASSLTWAPFQLFVGR